MRDTVENIVEFGEQPRRPVSDTEVSDHLRDQSQNVALH